ncbi:salt-induced outer membrane protein [Alcanivorax hongdengensis A-11-3]|uniref:Salt-induced outer membrane protein n=1 Tax=Alcanivorax hongdengensis A-11-3 TaxID=1177179 RepID=L0WCV8_9GAMM|nr:DUF481 domain-containing protein [Alcanivorax hongdengensis]EKF73580.1 salt-induced outer membrane protein [Alcanivorax hongdengensis A-11-3]
MRSKYLAAMVLAAGLPAVTMAAETEGSDGADKAKWSGDMALGLLFQRGNTNSDSLNASINATRDSAFWRHTFKADANNEKEKNPDTDEYQRTAENYYASYKLDRKLGENSKNYLFNVGTYEKDTFSGYQYEASYALGLGRRWLETDRQTLDLELGPGYRVQCLEPEDSYGDCANTEESAIARLGLKYTLQVTENSDFRQEVTSEFGDGSAKTRSESVFDTKINSHFSLRLRYLLETDSNAPDGTENTDQEFSVGLAYKFK